MLKACAVRQNRVQQSEECFTREQLTYKDPNFRREGDREAGLEGPTVRETTISGRNKRCFTHTYSTKIEFKTFST